MLQQAVSFCQFYSRIINQSLQIPEVCLNAPSLYAQIANEMSRKILQKYKVAEIISKNSVNMSKILISIQQAQGQEKAPGSIPSNQLNQTTLAIHSEIPQSQSVLRPISFGTNIEGFTKQSGQPIKIDKKQRNESGIQKQKEKQKEKQPISLVSFKVSQSDKQSQIMIPSVSQNVGCFSGFKNRLASIAQCNFNCCDPVPLGRQPFQISGTDKDMKLLFSKKNIPNIPKN